MPSKSWIETSKPDLSRLQGACYSTPAQRSCRQQSFASGTQPSTRHLSNCHVRSKSVQAGADPLHPRALSILPRTLIVGNRLWRPFAQSRAASPCCVSSSASQSPCIHCFQAFGWRPASSSGCLVHGASLASVHPGVRGKVGLMAKGAAHTSSFTRSLQGNAGLLRTDSMGS